MKEGTPHQSKFSNIQEPTQVQVLIKKIPGTGDELTLSISQVNDNSSNPYPTFVNSYSKK